MNLQIKAEFEIACSLTKSKKLLIKERYWIKKNEEEKCKREIIMHFFLIPGMIKLNLF